MATRSLCRRRHLFLLSSVASAQDRPYRFIRSLRRQHLLRLALSCEVEDNEKREHMNIFAKTSEPMNGGTARPGAALKTSRKNSQGNCDHVAPS